MKMSQKVPMLRSVPKNCLCYAVSQRVGYATATQCLCDAVSQRVAYATQCPRVSYATQCPKELAMLRSVPKSCLCYAVSQRVAYATQCPKELSMLGSALLFLMAPLAPLWSERPWKIPSISLLKNFGIF